MTVVNPKSISGINSITMASGSDNLLTIHTTNTTERVRVNSDGDVIVGSGITVSPDGDIFATGVTTATTFVGALTGTASGNPTLTNGSNNRVVTATGANGLTGESTLLFDGNLIIDSDSGHLQIGDDQDLDIYHNGSNGYIKNGTGQLLIRSGTHTFENAAGSTEYARIDSSGQFSLGRTSQITGNGNSSTSVFEQLSNSNYPLALHSSQTNKRGLLIFYATTGAGNAGDPFIACTDNTNNKFQVTSDGTTTIRGNLVMATAGKGIDFSATGDGATVSSELLDDYEEGTWTPVLNGTHSNMGTGLGKYAKVGSITHYWIEFGHVVAGNGSFNANTYISGFPFSTPNHPPNHWTGTASYMNSAYGMTLMTNYYNSADQFYITQAAGSLRYLWCQVSVCNF